MGRERWNVGSSSFNSKIKKKRQYASDYRVRHSGWWTVKWWSSFKMYGLLGDGAGLLAIGLL